MLNSGTLNKRVRIERLTQSTNDPKWGTTSTWEPVRDLWAQINQVAGTEGPGPSGITSNTIYKIAIRHQSDLSTHDRLVIVSTGKVLDIVSIIDPAANGVAIEVMCREHHG